MNRLKIRRLKREDEKGAMGIGTLIIFIAMVLVAAVAASVLISTAYDLQQQAQQTGSEAIREVSTSFVVKDVYGVDEGGTSDQLDDIYIKIGLSAGAPKQDFDQTLIEIDDGTTHKNLEIDLTNPEAPIDADEYHVSAVIDQDGDFNNATGAAHNAIIEAGDTMKIEINATNSGLTLTPQTDVSIRIIPKHGTPVLETFSTPPVYINDITHLA